MKRYINLYIFEMFYFFRLYQIWIKTEQKNLKMHEQ